MRIVLGALAFLATAANAAFTITYEPANPTPADTIVVTIRDSSPSCPTLRPRAMRFEPPNMIRLEYLSIGDCPFGPFSEAKVTIGRLPAGSYTIGLGRDSSDISPAPGPEVTVPMLVSFVGGANGEVPYDDYAGQYLTGSIINGNFVQQYGEGVTIEQYGEKSFVTLLNYDGSGRATWLVMTDARWRRNAEQGRYEFSGAVYRATRGEESPPTVRVLPVGTGTWFPTSFDTLTLDLTIDGTRHIRTLRRFRF